MPTGEGWLYVATVIDLASRALVGWSMSDRPDATLVGDALKAAVAARGRSKMHDTIFHSDRGFQYTSEAFRTLCRDLGVQRSCGRTGSCLDNAVAESFFATLKIEVCRRRKFATRAEARRHIFRWVNYYNTRRLHSTIGYMTPTEYEQQLRIRQNDQNDVSSAAAA